MRPRKKMIEWYPKNPKADNEGIFSYKKQKQEVSMDFVRAYRGFFYKLVEVTGCSRDLMEFLVEEMNGDNIVNNNKYTRDKFLGIANRDRNAKSPKYRDPTVNQAFHELKDRGLISSKEKGTFRVNPQFFWKTGNEKKREEAIKMELHFADAQVPKINVSRISNIKSHKNKNPSQ